MLRFVRSAVGGFEDDLTIALQKVSWLQLVWVLGWTALTTSDGMHDFTTTRRYITRWDFCACVYCAHIHETRR